MTTYTLNDLLYAKGTSEPVRQMLLSMAEKIEQLEARLSRFEPIAIIIESHEVGGINDIHYYQEDIDALPIGTKLYAAPPQRERVQFPTMLRKMWSGGEVQAWLDENVNLDI